MAASFLRADLGGGNVELHFAQRLRKRIEQPDPILGFNFNERARFRSFVVEADPGGNLFPGVSR